MKQEQEYESFDFREIEQNTLFVLQTVIPLFLLFTTTFMHLLLSCGKTLTTRNLCINTKRAKCFCSLKHTTEYIYTTINLKVSHTISVGNIWQQYLKATYIIFTVNKIKFYI